jgi:hypothetical protein
MSPDNEAPVGSRQWQGWLALAILAVFVVSAIALRTRSASSVPDGIPPGGVPPAFDGSGHPVAALARPASEGPEHRAEVIDDTFHGRIQLIGIDARDIAGFEVTVRRATTEHCTSLPVDSSGAWSGILTRDAYRLVGIRCPTIAYEPDSQPVPDLEPSSPMMTLTVVRRGAWNLRPVDALDPTAMIQRLTITCQDGPVGRDAFDQHARVPIEPPGKAVRYEVEAPGYLPAILHHHGSQGDVVLPMWPTGTLRIARSDLCTVSVRRPGDTRSVYEEESPTNRAVRVRCGAGVLEVVAQWECGASTHSVTLRRGEEASLELDPPTPVPVEMRLTGLFTDSFARTLVAQLYTCATSGRKVMARDWHRHWLAIRDMPIRQWREAVPGQDYATEVNLAPGRYLLALSHVGLQTTFEVGSGQLNLVVIEAFDLRPTRFDLTGWPTDQWPLDVSWRYEGDAVALSGLLCRQGEQAIAMLLPKPLEVVAIGPRGDASLPIRHVPGQGVDPVIRLPPDNASPMLFVDLLRHGLPAHLDDQLQVDATPLAHDGAMASWGRDGKQHSSVFLKFTTTGGYRVTGTRGKLVVFEQDVAVHANGSRVTVDIE